MVTITSKIAIDHFNEMLTLLYGDVPPAQWIDSGEQGADCGAFLIAGSGSTAMVDMIMADLRTVSRLSIAATTAAPNASPTNPFFCWSHKITEPCCVFLIHLDRPGYNPDCPMHLINDKLAAQGFEIFDADGNSMAQN